MLNPDRPVSQKAERTVASQEELYALAIGLLRGSVEYDPYGLPRTKYLDESEERDARRALVILLCSDGPLDRDMRCALAALFDPGDTFLACAPYVPHERKLVIQFRDRKRRTDYVRNTAIAQHVFRIIQGGKSWEKAIAEVANKFDLSDARVRTIWRRYQNRRDLL
jgi:hypothetical protein